MRNIARLPENDRRELFRNTADKMGLNDAIVEKDFWVCFTLDYLFHRCPWRNSITFKGGTSLSKAFNLISRFSEDHDLPDAQARAMLKSPSPLADVFADWEHKETGHMDDIWQTVEDWAKAEEQKHRKKEQKER